jgi:hypothetical protein
MLDQWIDDRPLRRPRTRWLTALAERARQRVRRHRPELHPAYERLAYGGMSVVG